MNHADGCVVLGFYHKMRGKIAELQSRVGALGVSPFIPVPDRRMIQELSAVLEDARLLLDEWRYDTLSPRKSPPPEQPRSRVRSGTRRLGVTIPQAISLKVPKDEGDDAE